MPGSTQKGRNTVWANDEPKNGVVIGFYEDITNIIVPNIKHEEPRYHGRDEWNLNCVYTYDDDSTSHSTSALLSLTRIGLNVSTNLGLSFRLVTTYEPSTEPDSDPDELVKSVRYEPQELQNEGEAFVAALGYMNGHFTFERTQFPLFLKSLREKVEEAVTARRGAEGGEDADDEDEEIEELAED